MNYILAIVDVVAIFSLEFVGTLSEDLGDLVGSLLYRTKLPCSYILCVLEESM